MEERIKKILKQLRFSESTISTFLGLTVVFVVGALLFNFFSKKPTVNVDDLASSKISDETVASVQPGQVEEGEKPKGVPSIHKVQKGETLWKIAEQYYGSGYNFVDIVKENNFANANAIVVDQELKIPDVSAKKQTISEIKTSVTVVSSQSISGETYTIVPRDTLWSIAVRAYGDGYQWPKIYRENKDEIGMNPSNIEEGIELKIPRDQ